MRLAGQLHKRAGTVLLTYIKEVEFSRFPFVPYDLSLARIGKR